jgi:5-dehydro-2-deoxygluconokinase
MARALASIYNADVYPDWWKLPPQATSNSWQAISDVIASRDPYCRGVLLLGLNASEADLGRDFATAAAFDICKGFAVGRSIFQRPADAWFAGRIDDAQAVATIAENYAKLIDLWRAQRPVCTTSAAVGS